MCANWIKVPSDYKIPQRVETELMDVSISEDWGSLIYMYDKNRVSCMVGEPGEDSEKCRCREFTDLHRGEIVVGGINSSVVRWKMRIDIIESKRRIGTWREGRIPKACDGRTGR